MSLSCGCDSKPSMAKILIWVEDGKTKVEVCDD